MINNSTIKSIQKGIVQPTSTTDILIQINSINPQKSIVLINGNVQYTGTYYKDTIGRIQLSTDKLIVGSSYPSQPGGLNVRFTWQVIEFY